MTQHKLALLGGAATLALTLGAAGPAAAFDTVDWTWTKNVDEFISKVVTINVEFEPTGMEEVEFWQTHIGDSSSTAITHDVYNDPTLDYEDRVYDITLTGSTDEGESLGVNGRTRGSLDVSGTAEGFVDVDFGHFTSGCGVSGSQVCTGEGSEDDRVGLIGIAGNPAGESLTEDGVPGSFGSEDPLTVDGQTSGRLGVVGSTSGQMDVTVSGQVVLPTPIAWNALRELPKVENVATSLGNSANLESDRMVELHGAQVLYGDGDVDSQEEFFGAAAVAALFGHTEHAGMNTHQSAAIALNAAAILGVIEPAQISAYAETYNVSQSQIENAATALGNNLSVNLDAQTSGDAVLIGDVTQFAYADVTSEAYMHNNSVQNYANLGRLEDALFSNTATSIGNNLSIKVNGPALGAVTPPTVPTPGGNE